MSKEIKTAIANTHKADVEYTKAYFDIIKNPHSIAHFLALKSKSENVAHHASLVISQLEKEKTL